MAADRLSLQEARVQIGLEETFEVAGITFELFAIPQAISRAVMHKALYQQQAGTFTNGLMLEISAATREFGTSMDEPAPDAATADSLRVLVAAYPSPAQREPLAWTALISPDVNFPPAAEQHGAYQALVREAATHAVESLLDKLAAESAQA